ncbi:MAG: hypothetical protein IT328_03875 [Caldilineaceae bacterium]|nr:hypothetical protein [Caldilineaceae bacterium]
MADAGVAEVVLFYAIVALLAVIDRKQACAGMQWAHAGVDEEFIEDIWIYFGFTM